MDKSLLIHKYFKNSLSENEEITFNTLLNEDKDFQKSFKEHQSLHRAFEINEAERLKQKLKQLDINDDKKIKKLNNNRWLFSIAASVLIIVGISFYLNYFNTSLYEKYFETYPNVYQPVIRGSSSQSPFVYYENGDFSQAEKEFEILLNSEDNPNLRFYYALSLLNQNQYEKANIEFEKLKSQDFEFLPEVYWYFALSQLQLDNSTKAKELLKFMNEKNWNFKKTERKEILEKL